MKLDLRIPLGWMFTLSGLALTFLGYSTSGDASFYAKSAGINVNLWWGLVLVAFGISMFLLGYRAQGPTEKKPRNPR